MVHYKLYLYSYRNVHIKINPLMQIHFLKSSSINEIMNQSKILKFKLRFSISINNDICNLTCR